MQFIGREIHDSVAQKLTLASIYSQRMEFENQLPGVSEKLRDINKIINDSLLELRQPSRNLTDTTLQNTDLKDLIRMECEQVNETGICTANFEVKNELLTDISVKNSLFRIIQEFIQNSIKHSECNEIKIKIGSSNNTLTMLLEDDGKGFDINKVRHNGIGLDNIRRRIQMLNGTHSFNTAMNKGVSLYITIPLITANH